MYNYRFLLPILVFALVSGCGSPRKPIEPTFGASPQLVEPESSLIPTVNIAPAAAWPEGERPVAAVGLQVNAFASGLDHPRWLYVLPNGDVLVAESNAPADSGLGGIRGWIMSKVMQRAGAGVPSANRISLLRDTDADGVVDQRSVFLENLNSPFGMYLDGSELYVANTDALVRFDYQPGATRLTGPGEVVAQLPAGPINHHWTKNVIGTPAGRTLLVTVGSNSNVGENGMDKEVNRAAILAINPATGETRIYASGLRNPNGLAWHPQSGELWTTVNERDELGDNLVPDYMTAVQEGAFYGWPYSYYGQHVDPRVEPRRPELVAAAVVPDYALGAHTAALGLAFYEGELLSQRYRNGAFVGLHGSWNRDPKSGYEVIFVPFDNGEPAGPPETILAGFLSEDGKARGRPVGVAVAADGAVLVADDVGNTIWRISPAADRGSRPAGSSG
tara:strand:+ start:1346 stop:2686 length:1341 start_codon:yes stop_codon:yes gene_type:complete